MRKGLCLVIAIVLASAALVACSNDSATTQQTPGVTEPAPTAEPTSTPTVVPTPMPTATPTPTPTPMATVPEDHMSKMDGGCRDRRRYRSSHGLFAWRHARRCRNSFFVQRAGHAAGQELLLRWGVQSASCLPCGRRWRGGLHTDKRCHCPAGQVQIQDIPEPRR